MINRRDRNGTQIGTATSTKSKPAPIGVAIIARDASKTLGRCLASIRPHVSQIVVCVDVLTKDRTAQVAKRGGAEVHPVKVSDWHECVQHGRVLAQHFANARQESFKHLDPSLDFHLWIDADDVLEGGELLPALCEAVPADSAGVWFPYDYAYVTRQDGQRRPNTRFHRERLLRTHIGETPITWTWKGRVHETVEPEGIQAKWIAEAPGITVVHQPGTHDTPASALRNMLLLEIDYEEDPNSQRTVFYLGNQHFAMGNWQEAINWYETLCGGLGTNPYELWQAYVYMSHAYQRLGDGTNAARAAYGAMDVVPQHPEPYFRLAELGRLSGEPDKALFWTAMGRKMSEPPFFVFKNPLDYTFNQRVIAGEALMDLGRISDARREWENASEVFVDERLAGALEDVKTKERNMHAAEAFVQMAGVLNGQATDLYESLPAEVKAFGRTRDIVMPELLKARIGLTPRIVFYCGSSLEPWYPGTIDETGIGGSETAVIEIAKRFAADGWTVDVYNNADRYEGVHDGVGYWDMKRSSWLDPCDVFVSWRQPMIAPHPHAGKNVLWCHDLNYGPDSAYGFTQKWDVIAGVSEWHAGMLGRYYGCEAVSLPNGINLERFGLPIRKNPFRCVYASSPDRGLSELFRFWPEIVKAEPTAELHLAYGWENIDRMIQMGRTDLVEFREKMTRQIEETPGVVWRGRLPQKELAQLYGESVAWLYPADFLEVSCISAMEAMAAGCVPVTTRAGALPETIGDAGFLLPGPPQSRAFGDLYPKVATGVLMEMNTQMIYREKGRERAKQFSWDIAYSRWLIALGFETDFTVKRLPGLRGRPRKTPYRRLVNVGPVGEGVGASA